MDNLTNTSIEQRARIRELLAEHDISITQQRLEIARVMLSRPQHLSADQVMDEVSQSDRYVSKATVYNTLGLFARKGLLREVIADPTRTFYDSNTTQHHHFYNVDSGELSDIPAQSIDLIAAPMAPDGTEIDGVEVIVRLRDREPQA